jgi:hypothetical protein
MRKKVAYPFPGYLPGLGLDARRIRHLLFFPNPQFLVISPDGMTKV